MEGRKLTPDMVERILSREIRALDEKMNDANERMEGMRQTHDEQIGELWRAVNKGITDIKDLLTSHAKDDQDALHEISTQVLARVPAWALAIMTIGASIIGAMVTYILDHLKFN